MGNAVCTNTVHGDSDSESEQGPVDRDDVDKMLKRNEPPVITVAIPADKPAKRALHDPVPVAYPAAIPDLETRASHDPVHLARLSAIFNSAPAVGMWGQAVPTAAGPCLPMNAVSGFTNVSPRKPAKRALHDPVPLAYPAAIHDLETRASHDPVHLAPLSAIFYSAPAVGMWGQAVPSAAGPSLPMNAVSGSPNVSRCDLAQGGPAWIQAALATSSWGQAPPAAPAWGQAPPVWGQTPPTRGEIPVKVQAQPLSNQAVLAKDCAEVAAMGEAGACAVWWRHHPRAEWTVVQPLSSQNSSVTADVALEAICPQVGATMPSQNPSDPGLWQVLPDLWLGSSKSVSGGAAKLMSHGISAVLNVSDHDHQMQGIDYLHLKILDSQSSDIIATFQQAKPFLDSVLERHGSVLIHCAVGMNRSASCCVAWLMTRGLTLIQAFELVFRRKGLPIIMNTSFRRQLAAFEAQLRSM